MRGALERVDHIQRSLISDGFVWSDIGGYVAKVKEELEEVLDASSFEDRESEIGDLLLAVTALAAHLEINGAHALQNATEKFLFRYNSIRKTLGSRFETVSQEELRIHWNKAKSLSPVIKKAPPPLPIGVIGSWDEEDKELLEVAGRVGAAAARRGIPVVTGGGPGTMRAAVEKAHEAGGLTIGILGTEDPKTEGAPDVLDIVLPTGMGWDMRSSLMIRMVSGIVVIGGAVGSLQEVTMAYMANKNISVFDSPGSLSDKLKEFAIEGVWMDKRKNVKLHFSKDIDLLLDIATGIL